MKKICATLFCVIPAFFVSAQNILLQEDFTTYDGTSATVPPGWTFSYNGNYTSSTYSGPSGPNSYKFGTNGASIETPVFSGADSLHFWIKGAATDNVSSLAVMESPDNVNWTTISTIVPLPTSGTMEYFTVQSTSTYLKFVYTKSAGNLAFDDFKLFGGTTTTSPSTGKITVYFNHPVNTAVSTGVPAVYLNNSADDTLIAYINRAKYTIDVSVYDYIQNSAISNIATAINNAYNRGVRIRWIYDGSATNSGISQLNGNINTLASPTGSPYNIMHDKFMIIDAHSSNPDDPIVWTGSMNWDDYQVDSDVNNIIIIQDQPLAQAYTLEFNQMWGDTGLAPNLSTSKFGPYKTSVAPHLFTIGGHQVELYFSPQDGTNGHIEQTLHNADDNLFFGMYTFTESPDADSIVARIQQHGVYAAGIMDQYSTSYTPYSTLNPVMGNNLKIYAQSSIYHNKFLVEDVCNPASDPLVLTGSHNWTATADTKNDENTLIIHDDTIANIYFQSFDQNFIDLGGTITDPCLPTAITTADQPATISVYPDPADENFVLQTSLRGQVKITLVNTLGQIVWSDSQNGSDMMNISTENLPEGIYFVTVVNDTQRYTKKLIIRHN